MRERERERARERERDIYIYIERDTEREIERETEREAGERVAKTGLRRGERCACTSDVGSPLRARVCERVERTRNI